MVSGSITKDGMSKGKVDPCGICSLRVKANSVVENDLQFQRMLIFYNDVVLWLLAECGDK